MDPMEILDGEVAISPSQVERDYYNLHRERFRKTLKYLRDMPVGRFCDVGSFYLHFAVLLSLSRHHTIAVDMPHLLQDLQYRQTFESRLQRYKIQFRPWTGIESPLPLDDASCDYLSCIETLEHLPCNHFRIVGEFRRILKGGGRLILTVPNGLRLWRVLSVISGRGFPPNIYEMRNAPWDSSLHFKEYFASELRFLMRENGFIIERLSSFNYTRPGQLGGRYQWLKKTLAPIARIWPLGGESLICIAKKTL